MGAGVGAGPGAAVGSGLGICTHRFGAFGEKQSSAHVQPWSHMQYQSLPNALQIPPACESQPCEMSKQGDTVGAGVGAGVGTGVGEGVHTGVGQGVLGTHVCGS